MPPGPGQPPPRAKLPSEARVVSVTDGDTIVLDGGSQVRLVGIQAPKLALGRKGFADWPLGQEAKAALERLVLGKRVRLYPGTTPFDRYGRILAQAYVDEKLWLQGAMLDLGYARAYTFKDNRGCAGALLEHERTARAGHRGIWALPAYAIRSAFALSQDDQGHFVLVEGRVVSAASYGDKAYLNFGANYREDFTGVIAAPDLALFRAEGYDLAGLKGQIVRVRGWLELFNGPMIAITHPEQIERLGAGAGDP